MATTKKKLAEVTEVAVQETAPAAAVEADMAEKPAKRAYKRKTAEAPAAVAAEKPVKRTRKAKDTQAPASAEKPAAKRAGAKSAKIVEKVYVQIMGKDATPEDMVARAKADWEAQGHSVSEIKTLSVYLNTAEGRVYYVVNDELNSGSFEF